LSGTKRPKDDAKASNHNTIHLAVDDEFASDLARVVAIMQQRNPEFRRCRVRIGRQKAIRYAVGKFLAQADGSARA
jgi:hypothetical protein